MFLKLSVVVGMEEEKTINNALRVFSLEKEDTSTYRMEMEEEAVHRGDEGKISSKDSKLHVPFSGMEVNGHNQVKQGFRKLL